jgi:hypothetical protein
MPEVEASIGVRLIVVEGPVRAGLIAARSLDPDNISAQPGQYLPAVLPEFVSDLKDSQAP